MSSCRSNTAYQSAEIEYFVGNAEPAVMVCTSRELRLGQQDCFQGGYPPCLHTRRRSPGSLLERAAHHSDQHEIGCGGRDDLAAILYTSGTTGRPKGAMLSHRNLWANASTLHRYWAFRAGDVLLHMLPIFHIHGLFVATHCLLMDGSPMLFEPRFDVRRALTLPKSTVFMGVPTYMCEC